MIALDNAGTRALSLITAQNGADVAISFSDYTTATGAYARGVPTLTTIASATTTAICATPASGAIRDVDMVNIKNTFAGSHTITVQITSGSGGPFVLVKCALLADESLIYVHGSGWCALDANGNRKEVTASIFSGVTVSGLTASLPVFTDANKALVSNTMTGTGNVVMSASPTLTGTIGAANQTLSGTLGVTGVTTLGTTVVNTSLSIGGYTSALFEAYGSAPITGIFSSSSTDSSNIRIINASVGGVNWAIVSAGSSTGIGTVGSLIFYNAIGSVKGLEIFATGAVSIPGTLASGALTVTGAISATTNLTAWAAYTPTRTGWTDVLAPTVTARYCQVRNVCHFQIKVVPGTTTATVAGTSYVTLPVTAAGLGGDASMQDLTTFISIGNCVFDVANSRLYVPSNAASADSLIIAGAYEV